jgi:hypothetical protein
VGMDSPARKQCIEKPGHMGPMPARRTGLDHRREPLVLGLQRLAQTLGEAANPVEVAEVKLPACLAASTSGDGVAHAVQAGAHLGRELGDPRLVH